VPLPFGTPAKNYSVPDPGQISDLDDYASIRKIPTLVLWLACEFGLNGLELLLLLKHSRQPVNHWF
jgi:hypothetical protein